MSTNDEFDEIEAPVQQTAEGRPGLSPLVDKEIEQGSNGHAKGREPFIKSAEPMFAIPSWHKPYAEALMAADPELQRALIQKAERAILLHSEYTRELPPAARESDLVDLGNAVRILEQLKNPSRVA